MQGPTTVSFKDTVKTPELEALIQRKIAKLERFCGYLISCRVIIEHPQHHQEVGSPYRVRIDMKIPPAHELVVQQASSKGDMHDPLNVVIIKTFRKAERILKGLVQKQRGSIKFHPQQQVMGIVNSLFPEQDYGFIKTVDTQQDVYFHRNSVLHNEFDDLQLGTGVRFSVEEGVKGLQASSVEIVYKPGIPNIAPKQGTMAY
ncbi:MAG: cold shock domain-containing protein [Planctomycetaceae bacterium]|nr:cold shock domain-containing protein [Planctomycetaceae bacterium]